MLYLKHESPIAMPLKRTVAAFLFLSIGHAIAQESIPNHLRHPAAPCTDNTTALSPGCTSSTPPEKLDLRDTVTGLSWPMTLGEIATYADHAVQQTDIGSPGGVARLDTTGAFDGDASPARVRTAGGMASRTMARHFNDILSPLDFGGRFDGGDESLSLDAYRGSFTSSALLRIPKGSFTDHTPPVSGYPGTQIWISDGASDAASGNSFRIFPAPTGDTVISNYAGTLNIAKNGNHAGDGAVVSVDYTINTPAKNWNTTKNPVYNAHFGITENCDEASIENRGQVYCLSSQLTAASYNGAIKTDANLFAIRPAITDSHGPRSQISGINTGVIDKTGLPSSKAGGIESAEIDLYASGADDGHDRVALLVGSQQQKDDSHNTLEVGNGILLRAGAYTFYDSAFQIMGAYKNAAIDLRYANTGCPGNICAPALWLGELGPVSFGRRDPNRIKMFGDYDGNMHLVTHYEDALELTGSGDTIIFGRLNAKQGVILPTMTEHQIRNIPTPVEGQIVNDKDAHSPAIFENGHWYHLPLGKEI